MSDVHKTHKCNACGAREGALGVSRAGMGRKTRVRCLDRSACDDRIRREIERAVLRVG
jgi:hypothetical protein